MIHEQCEEIGYRDIWKKSWHDKTHQTHMEKEEHMLAPITHQTGREHPQSLETNMRSPECWSQT